MYQAVFPTACALYFLLGYWQGGNIRQQTHSAKLQGHKEPVDLGAALYSQYLLNNVGQSQSLHPPVHESDLTLSLQL